jgi:hypothetical protein
MVSRCNVIFLPWSGKKVHGGCIGRKGRYREGWQAKVGSGSVEISNETGHQNITVTVSQFAVLQPTTGILEWWLYFCVHSIRNVL